MHVKKITAIIIHTLAVMKRIHVTTFFRNSYSSFCPDDGLPCKSETIIFPKIMKT